MSNIKKLYANYIGRLMKEAMEEATYKTEPIMIDTSDLSEKEKCKLLGIACSYGICSDCNNFNRDLM